MLRALQLDHWMVMLHSGFAGWLHEQHRGSRVSHVFRTMPKHTTCSSSIAVHSSVWAQSCNYGCGSAIITFHLKLTRKRQTIAPDAVVRKRYVSSLGLLHSTDSIVQVTANWFYSVLQFAKTDKDGFPRLLPIRSSLSLRHKQLIDHFDDVANCYLGMWGKQTSCSSDSFSLSPCRHLQSLAEVIHILGEFLQQKAKRLCSS